MAYAFIFPSEVKTKTNVNTTPKQSLADQCTSSLELASYIRLSPHWVFFFLNLLYFYPAFDALIGMPKTAYKKKTPSAILRFKSLTIFKLADCKEIMECNLFSTNSIILIERNWNLMLI